MATTTPTPSDEKANGLATYLNVLMSPTAAFQQLAKMPTWGWAAVTGLIIALVATYMIQPASMHFTHAFQQQMLSHATADQRPQFEQSFAQQNAGAAWKAYINPVIGLAVSWMFATLVFLAASALGGGSGTFGKAWAVAVNAALPSYVGLFVNALIIMLRGPDSANTMSDLFAIPSPAMLVSGNLALAGFLSQINPFQLWYAIVGTIGAEQTLGAKRPAAITAVVVIVLATACVYAVLGAITSMFAK
jgi:hypothetical protein